MSARENLDPHSNGERHSEENPEEGPSDPSLPVNRPGASLRELLAKPREFYADDPEYRALLTEAQQLDFSDFAELDLLYKAPGLSANGHVIVVFLASRLPQWDAAEYDRLKLYLIRTLHDIVCYPYEMVYVHSGIQHTPSFGWLKNLYGTFSRTYKKNLKELYILHPNWKVKGCFHFGRAFISKKFWRKLHYSANLRALFSDFEDSSLCLPSEVYTRDFELSGEATAEPIPPGPSPAGTTSEFEGEAQGTELLEQQSASLVHDDDDDDDDHCVELHLGDEAPEDVVERLGKKGKSNLSRKERHQYAKAKKMLKERAGKGEEEEEDVPDTATNERGRRRS